MKLFLFFSLTSFLIFTQASTEPYEYVEWADEPAPRPPAPATAPVPVNRKRSFDETEMCVQYFDPDMTDDGLFVPGNQANYGDDSSNETDEEMEGQY